MEQAELSRPMKSLAELETDGERPPAHRTKHLDLDAKIRPADLKGKRLPLRKRAARALARVLIIFGMGVASTLAWQSYGDALRARIASSYPQLGWLAPQPAVHVEAPANTVVTLTAASAPSPDYSEQLKSGLAAVRESVNQVIATQQWMAGDIAKLQTGQQDILDKIGSTLGQQDNVDKLSSPPPTPAPPPAASPASKPTSAARRR
jgi:hypothetical protein